MSFKAAGTSHGGLQKPATGNAEKYLKKNRKKKGSMLIGIRTLTNVIQFFRDLK
ncbi:MAG TPA: hypothetical protein VG605_12615 [Puia sp.]|nr:hypothetical protein [Puia sp.]